MLPITLSMFIRTWQFSEFVPLEYCSTVSCLLLMLVFSEWNNKISQNPICQIRDQQEPCPREPNESRVSNVLLGVCNSGFFVSSLRNKTQCPLWCDTNKILDSIVMLVL